ncbi:MAG: hypothetical protein ACRC10_04880 [Thermoguttaceae bacterium]
MSQILSSQRKIFCLLFCLCVIALFQTGCHFASTQQKTTPNRGPALKKSGFSVPKLSDKEFEQKIANDPFPNANSP